MPSITSNQSSLFNRLLEGELSPQETEALIEWIGSEELDPATVELIISQLKQPLAQEHVNPAVMALLDAKLPDILAKANDANTPRIQFLKQRWLKYAAIFIILFGLSALLFLSKSSKQTTGTDTVTVSKKDIAPGKEGAILTLDDGRVVVLDSLGNGVIATQNGVKVLLKNGQLVYDRTVSDVSHIAYNTMTTPRGRQFQVVLPDGSKAWLNAASSLRYPTIFAGKERNVEVTGEVYFEVAKNAKMPFKVKINNETEIEVLGTHFNINSYNNENTINTTLLEGSVVIRNKSQQAILKPGEQAQVGFSLAGGNPNQLQQIKVMNNVNLEKVMAWKNGVFDFQDATLEEVMHQLERWYDIDVVYEKGIPKLEFIGRMGRDLSLSDVLRGLEVSKVHCKLMEGRKLVIMP